MISQLTSQQKIKTMNNEIKALYDGIMRAKRIVAFTGAGVSVPSGIPDFRSANGLFSTPYGQFSAEEVVSHDFFFAHNKDFYNFYINKMVYPSAKPNDMHLLLARLEDMGKLTSVVTQNIDGLHQLAGSKRVYELHGSVKRNYCTKCHTFYDEKYVVKSHVCEECGGLIKPDVVLYGESLDDGVVSGAIHDIRQADMFIVIGTSLVVYPAAGLVHYFRGDNTAIINKSHTAYDTSANILINDDCAHVAQEIASLMGIQL